MREHIEVKAASRTLRQMMVDPISWVPFLPFAAAYSFLGAPWWACTAGAVAAGAGIVAWWRTKWSKLRTENEQALILEESAKDNARIEETIASLSRKFDGGKADSAIHKLITRVPGLLASKRAIESSIMEDGRISAVEHEIAMMVGDLARASVADMERLAATREGTAERERLCEAIEKAVAAMDRTREEIDLLIRPSRGMMPAMESAAADRAQRLEDRLAEARSIRNRLERDLKSTDVIIEGDSGKLTQ